MTQRTEYGENELRVMTLMAHGKTRLEIAGELHISPSSVARAARLATDRATGSTGASIIYGVAVLVARGHISVSHQNQESTAYKTALAWLETRLMSCLDWREFVEIRNAYRAMKTEGETR